MKRHVLSTRIWHWLNLLCVVVLFMSGLTISNAHRLLYWGDWGFDRSQAWLEVPRFPDWMTIPGYYSLAVARDWHILHGLALRARAAVHVDCHAAQPHFKRDLDDHPQGVAPQGNLGDIVEHVEANFDHGEGKYNFQKLAYGLVLGIFLPMMVFTGIAISPGMEPTFGWLVDLLGGRQSARSLHFIFAFAILGFFIVHVALVLLSGPIGQMRAMITGGPTHEA